MLKGITVAVTSKDRAKLEAVITDRNSPQKHVWRAQIVLLTADGCGTAEIMRRSGNQQDGCVALARALHDRGCRRPVAR